MKVFGIFGWPLAQTLSPTFQNAAFKSLGLPAIYLALPVASESFEARFAALSKLPYFYGANVTVPHKVPAWELLKKNLSPEARAIGAVNTIVRQGQKWKGHNTDAQGFALSMKAAGLALKGRKVLLLGAGGSARAISYGLLKSGAALCIASRRLAQGQALARRFSKLGPCKAVKLQAAGLQALMQDADLIVNTVPGREFAMRASRSLRALQGRKALCDISYSHAGNPLLKAARKKGWKAVDGLGMLLAQGALSFRLWTGKAAPLAAMKAALDSARN